MAERRSGSPARAVRSALVPVFALIALLGAAPAAFAQSTVLRIEVGSITAVVRGDASGGVAYPVSAIVHLGGWMLDESAGSARAVLFGDTLVFRAGSDRFEMDGVEQRLGSPARTVARQLFVPERFFSEWLPARYPRRLAWRDGGIREPAPADMPAERPAVPAADPPTTDSAAAATPIVIIDPGHGGRDTGKIGPNGLREKDVALELSKRVAAYLEARGFEARLTRTRDTLIALADRPALANEWRDGRPAVFLSIHANAFTLSRVKGFETFFLSEARTDDERRVAEMENASFQFDEPPAAASSAVDFILNDIRNDFYIRASNDLAVAVQDRLASFHTGPNRGVKRAGFRVLVGALMPAVLIEVAFISNPQEARLLASTAFQEKLVSGIGDAVERFFKANGHLWSGDRGPGGERR